MSKKKQPMKLKLYSKVYNGVYARESAYLGIKVFEVICDIRGHETTILCTGENLAKEIVMEVRLLTAKEIMGVKPKNVERKRLNF